MTIKDIIKVLEFRKKYFESELRSAIKKQEWSKVAGFDGISLGIEIAINTLKEE